MPALQLGQKFGFSGFEWIKPQLAERARAATLGQKTNASEASNVCVAEFTSVIERKKYVGMRHNGRSSRMRDQFPRHTEVNQQSGGPATFL